MRRVGSGKADPLSAQSAKLLRIIPLGLPMNLRKLLSAIVLLSLPAMAQAADITGVPKIREGDQLQIGNHRIRLGGIDAPAADQLCLNTKGERWTCGVAARDELIKRFGNKSWTCRTRAYRSPRPHRGPLRGRRPGHPEMAGDERLGAGLVRVSRRLRGRREGRTRGQGGDVAGRVHRAVGLARPQQEDRHSRRDQAAGKRQGDPAGVGFGPVAPSPDCTIKGNVNRSGECIYHQPTSRWYAKIQMKISKGTRWFCSVEEAEAAGCRETETVALDVLGFPAFGKDDRRAGYHKPTRIATVTQARPLRRAAKIALVILIAYGLLAYLILPALLDPSRASERPRRPADGDAHGAGHSRRSHQCRADRRHQGRGMLDARGRLVSRRPITLKSSIEIVGSVLLDRPYKDAPVSNLYYLGRREDLAYEKPIGASADQRNHVRYWKVLESGAEKRPVWLGAATRDRGVGVSKYTGAVTHHISPDLDAERALLAADLENAGMVEAKYQVTGIGPTVAGHNGGGDLYYTDGEIWVLRLVEACKKREGPAVTIPSPPATELKDQIWRAIANAVGK